LQDLFVIKKFECGGIDGFICKLQMVAMREGRIDNANIGLPIVVKDTRMLDKEGEEVTLTVEVKRVGLLIDRNVDLELRIGDTLVLYISQTSA